MIVRKGKGKSIYGAGIDIVLTGDDVARAISAYLIAHGIYVDGVRTIRVNDELCASGNVYVDPSGFVIHDGEKIDGRTGLPTPRSVEGSLDS